MEPAEGRAERRDDGKFSAHRRGSAPPRARGDGRPAPEPRRKRSAEQRFAGWGDGLERVSCASAIHHLPTGFPVQSRDGVATIPQTVVARRPDALLICNYAHCGPHCWPDGEIVDEPRDGPPAEGAGNANASSPAHADEPLSAG